MQSRWKELEEIHTSLERSTASSINPESWQQVIKSTLTESSPNDSVLCHVSPAVCHHCHQLAALSAVTMMMLTVKQNGWRQMEETYLQPLLTVDVLKPMVALLLNPCQFLRYQARRTLAALLTSECKEETTDQCITEACVETVMQNRSGSILCVEPLQLLCTMLSKRLGHRLSVKTSEFLLPYLPALYSQCCQTSVGGREELMSEKNDTLAQIESVQERGSAKRLKVLSETNKLCDITLIERSPSKQPQLALSSQQQPTSESLPCVQHEQAAGDFIDDRSHDPRQSESLHYVFLCLVQKVSKLINLIEEPDKSSQLKLLNKSTLFYLIREHLQLFREDLGKENSYCLLAERKFLDVMDTVLCYSGLRTQNISGSVYETVAKHFVHNFKTIDCSWSFSIQHTFIGGVLIKKDWRESDSKEDGRTVDLTVDEDCCPVLVLLVAVLLKSCAIVFKAGEGQKGEAIKPCTALLLSMHHGLHDLQHRGSPPMDSTPAHYKTVSTAPAEDTPVDKILARCTPECRLHLDWLPQVCGEQDDRWVEALLCSLDIVVHAQAFSCREDDDVKSLITLLDPHRLFIQMLHLTNYDTSLLIDWLTSPETCFLAYLVRYLHLLAADFPAFCQAARIWNCSGDAWSCPLGDVKVECYMEGQSVNCGQSGEHGKKRSALNTLILAEGEPSTAEDKQSQANNIPSSAKQQFTPSQSTSKNSNVEGNEGWACSAQKTPAADETGTEATRGGKETFKPSSYNVFDSDRPVKRSAGLALLSAYDDDGDSDVDESDDYDDIANEEHDDDDSDVDESDDYDDIADEEHDDDSFSDHGVVVTDALDCVDGHISDDNIGDDFEGAGSNLGSDAPCMQQDQDFHGTESLYQVSRGKGQQHHDSETMNSTKLKLAKQSRCVAKMKAGPVREVNSDNSAANCINRVMSLLTGLRKRLQKLDSNGLLVYNPKPLVRLLQRCEEGYGHQQFKDA